MRNFILSVMLLITGVLCAQQPVITFTKTTHDFGRINEADGRVTTIFEFKNEGMEPLVLSNVRASCGCTTPKWTKTPVEPGQTGSISVTYNPNGRPGKFQKSITVTSNAEQPTVKLYIKGEVIPKAAKQVNKYPVKMGDLSLNANTINYGTIYKGNNQTKALSYTNTTDQDLTIEVLTADSDPIIAQASLTPIKKGQEGEIHINLDAAKGKHYGPQTFYVYVVVNGKKQLTDEYKITLSANVEEDFSKLTPQEKQNAPIVEVQKKFDLGEIQAGKKTKKSFTFRNAGINPLYVRAIINQSEQMFRASASKTTLKSGKQASIAIELNGMDGNESLKPGEYNRMITLMTNDPVNPKIQIVIHWTVK